MRTTRPLFEGERRHHVAVSIPLMRTALRDVIRGRVKLVDVEWDAKNDQIKFYYETEQDVLAGLENGHHAVQKAREEWCDCKTCEEDRAYEKKTGKCSLGDKPLGECDCEHCGSGTRALGRPPVAEVAMSRERSIRVFRALFYCLPVRIDAPEDEYATHYCNYCSAAWQQRDIGWRRLRGDGCQECIALGEELSQSCRPARG